MSSSPGLMGSNVGSVSEGLGRFQDCLFIPFLQDVQGTFAGKHAIVRVQQPQRAHRRRHDPIFSGRRKWSLPGLCGQASRGRVAAGGATGRR